MTTFQEATDTAADEGEVVVDAPFEMPEIDLTDPETILTNITDWAVSPTGGIALAMSVVKFIVILVIAAIVARVAARVAVKALESSRLHLSSLLRDFISNTIRKVVFLVGLMMALGELGVEVGPLIAGLGVAGFVIGFALQDSLANFAAGVMILLYRPYDIGDYVTVAGESGSVTSMSLVSTVLKTPDNQVLTIPNGKIWGDTIRNVTASETRRIDLVFGIGYGDDMDAAKTALLAILDEHPLVLKDPAPQVEVSELADSSVNFVVRPWVKTSDYWATRFEITKTVKERFDAAGISIPFPQRDVHVFEEQAS